MKQLSEKLASLDALIKAGKLDEVHQYLKNTPFRDIPREFKSQFAGIARRVNKPYWALKLLNPIVRSDVPVFPEVSDEEKIQYGACLIRIGSLKEGFDLLSSVDSEQHPECLLYQSIGLINQWKYKESVPFLNKYLQNDKVSQYQKLVALMNLATALENIGSYKSADTTLDKIIEQAKSDGHNFVYGYATQYKGIIAYRQKQYELALKYLKDSIDIFGSSSNLYKFFSEKWMVFTELKMQEHNPNLVTKLNFLRQKAENFKHGESLRECDLFEAMETNDLNLYNKVYFGTSSEDYKNRILSLSNNSFTPSDEFSYMPTSESHIDIHISTGAGLSNPGGVTHKCFNILASDLYKPFNLGQLFSELYEGEIFDPNTSPDRVYKVIKRLRLELKKNNTGLEIKVNNNQFQLLRENQTCSIHVPKHFEVKSKNELYLEVLENKFHDECFSISQARSLLQLSNQQAYRILKDGLEMGHLLKSGRGRSVKYQFAMYQQTNLAA